MFMPFSLHHLNKPHDERRGRFPCGYPIAAVKAHIRLYGLCLSACVRDRYGTRGHIPFEFKRRFLYLQFCHIVYKQLQQKYPAEWAGIFTGAAGQIRTAGCLPLRGCIRTDPPACAGSTCPPGTGRQFKYPGDAKNPRPRWGHGFSGAAGQIRTADLILTKDALYRLSYSSILAPWKEGARCVATEMGLEPTTSSVTG